MKEEKSPDQYCIRAQIALHSACCLSEKADKLRMTAGALDDAASISLAKGQYFEETGKNAAACLELDEFEFVYGRPLYLRYTPDFFDWLKRKALEAKQGAPDLTLSEFSLSPEFNDRDL